MKIIVTGGAGFIGSALIRYLLTREEYTVLNLDKLTYAGNPASLDTVLSSPRYLFEQADIGDRPRVARIFREFTPDAILHLAAESHVDRSIDDPSPFVETNVGGTFTLLETARAYWRDLPEPRRQAFRFHHISTDEVFGSLDREGRFHEETPYRPNSPYSASKAASDHLVRAWGHTYGLPILITNCSNNYGPCQFPEKLIPLMILKCLERQPLPVYGKGDNIRDWLYVEDHVLALETVLRHGRPGETYNIGGNCEKTNLEVVREVAALMDRLAPLPGAGSHAALITFVTDRPGHDLRYAIDAGKITRELGWQPRETFASGLEKTVRWYLDNRSWWGDILAGKYQGQRIGLL